MFSKPRVQSLINLDLTKFFRFREKVVEIEEVYELMDTIFPSMARNVVKQHKLTQDEYLSEVREALEAFTDSTDFWIAQAKAGWVLAFPEE